MGRIVIINTAVRNWPVFDRLNLNQTQVPVVSISHELRRKTDAAMEERKTKEVDHDENPIARGFSRLADRSLFNSRCARRRYGWRWHGHGSFIVCSRPIVPRAWAGRWIPRRVWLCAGSPDASTRYRAGPPWRVGVRPGTSICPSLKRWILRIGAAPPQLAASFMPNSSTA